MGILFKIGVTLAAAFVLILYMFLLFGPPIEAEEKEVTQEVTVERTVEVPVERTIEVESAEARAERAERRADFERGVEEARQKDEANKGEGDDLPGLPNLPNPDLPNIPGSHCIGKGIFRVCV